MALLDPIAKQLQTLFIKEALGSAMSSKRTTSQQAPTNTLCTPSNSRWFALLSLPLTLFPLPGYSAGFAILEQSAKRMGTAFAGAGVVGDDASEMWYNPASLTAMDASAQFASHLIFPSIEFNSNSSAVTAPASAALFASSDPRDDAGARAFVPSFAYVTPLQSGSSSNQRQAWYAGLSINAPFGLATEYNNNWLGRYRALDSAIASININPALAFKINEHWAFGFGVNVNYTEVSLSSAIDVAGVCAQLVGGICPNGAPPSSGVFDGEVEVTGDDVSLGYNLGLWWQASPGTRLGFAYRSEIEHEIEGEGDFLQPVTLGGLSALGPVLGAGLAATFTDSDASADLTLPATFSISARHALNERTALLADASWTGWDSLQEIRIDFANPATPTSVEELNWTNTWRFSLGVEHALDDSLSLRLGYAVDESPVPNRFLRTPRLPDNDRQIFATGLSKRISNDMSIDASYAFVKMDDTEIEWTRANGDHLAGDYDSHGHNLSVAVNLLF